MSEFVPWEQLADETSEAWASFVRYRDAGPTRSIVETARSEKRCRTQTDKWRRMYNWSARVRAWDAEVDRIRRQKFLSEQRRIIKLHAEAAGVVRAKAMEAVEAIEGSELRPIDAIKWLEFACKLEAQSCGLPTEVTALSLTGGQPNDTADVFFESLPREQLLDIVKMSMTALQKDGGGNPSERDGQEPRTGQLENQGTTELESGTRLRLGRSESASADPGS